MLEKILQVFKIKELRDKIFFVLGILVVFRLAANIPVPGVNVDQLGIFLKTISFSDLSICFRAAGSQYFHRDARSWAVYHGFDYHAASHDDHPEP